MKKSIRSLYAKKFGEDETRALESAAEGHKNGVHDKPGSDPFKWAIVIAIGYQCVEIDKYRRYHGINANFNKWKKWVKENAELGSHDGDSDYLTLARGAYAQYIKKVSV